MRIGIFTDPHYSSKEVSCGVRYNSLSLKKIEQAYLAFAKSGCELAICLGDLADTEDSVEAELENIRQIGALIGQSGIPTVCLMGNHDAFTLTAEQFYSSLGIAPPRTLVKDGKRLIFLDACFFKDGRHYVPGDSDWTDCYLPNAEELKDTLAESSEEVYLFMHQNTDPDIRADHAIFNRDRVSEIIESSGKVRAVYQGHYHPGHRSVHGGVEYITLPAMCENENAFFTVDI